MQAGRIRALDPSEKFFAMANAYIGYSAVVRGELNIAALSTAFAALRRRYPVLSAALEAEADGFAIVARPGPLPGVVVGAGDIDAVLSDICADQNRVLSGLQVVQDGDRAAVTLFTHHSIADGYHSLALLGELWSLYTDTVAGLPVDDVVHGYPESLEQVLAERGITKVDNGIQSAAPVGEGDSPAFPPRPRGDRVRVFQIAAARCRLDTAATAHLLAYARRNETTLNGVLSALILRVEAEFAGVPPQRVSYSYPVNLRTRITPPVENTAATDPLGFAAYVATGDLTDTPAIARDIIDELRKDLESQAIHQSGLRFYDDMGSRIAQVMQLPADERPIGVISTNWGVVPELRGPHTLEFEDFRTVMTEAAVDPEATFGPPATYILSTFQDRLAIELRAAVAPEETRKRLAAVESALLALR